ncbi:glycosyltransferase [Phreatobacter stygius]|uniref:Glycosyltransferase n=1 Tax=Phreatobacter stygius TaxID=1940610 RepID=A0A4D7BE88_9HYPH|nr:glycosyltransferase [Phreatobacter stygius]
MDILFVHNNFPAQFRHIAKKFASYPNIRVKAIGMSAAPGMPGVELQKYNFSGRELSSVHAFARRFEIEARRGEQVIYAANALKVSGFHPKLIYVHPGWGESLPLRSLFPGATICSYSEFYYWPFGADVGFDKEFPSFGVDGEVRISLRNAATLLSLVDADLSIAPTHWQRTVFPKEFHPKIHVVHDGLDVARLTTLGAQGITQINGEAVRPGDEIVTFVARSLEPYRGFHIFMRALPAILRARPKARICIVGQDNISYGIKPEAHANWRQAMVAEVGAELDLSRVHFLGHLPYEKYLRLLKVSSAHVYLTYPFVLSWSMLEAMALGCLIIGSDTPPVTEIIQDGVNGVLVPFFGIDEIAAAVVEALGNPQRYAQMRSAAAETVRKHYDFESVIWPAHVGLLQEYVLSNTVLDTIGLLPPDEAQRAGGMG